MAVVITVVEVVTLVTVVTVVDSVLIVIGALWDQLHVLLGWTIESRERELYMMREEEQQRRRKVDSIEKVPGIVLRRCEGETSSKRLHRIVA
jgi:hypothetical protein